MANFQISAWLRRQKAGALTPVLVAVIALLALPAADFVSAQGRMDDDSFYKLVACGAKPGGACREPLVRWAPSDAADLTIGITEVKTGFPETKRPLAEEALSAAVAEVNAAGAAVQMREVGAEDDPHITVHLWDQDEGEPIKGSDLSNMNGIVMGQGYVHIWWDGRRNLTRGVILISRDIAPGDLKSIMLEEVTQSLGLLTDINNPWYDTRSIFAETSNYLTALQRQDKMVLQRHYPLEN
ncbi:MAG: DUF2927 domain-containing protein [Litoreibacter sp.]|nr:DUF2927 domain-containing protein [Litoreibacter sp.]